MKKRSTRPILFLIGVRYLDALNYTLSFTEATKKTNNQAEIDQKLNNHPASKKSHIIFSLLLLQYSENVGKGRKFQIGDCKKLAITAAYIYRETSETHSWTEPQAFVLLEYFSLETAF